MTGCIYLPFCIPKATLPSVWIQPSCLHKQENRWKDGWKDSRQDSILLYAHTRSSLYMEPSLPSQRFFLSSDTSSQIRYSNMTIY